jgi:rfaE bifunctional protein kinase chain/domain
MPNALEAIQTVFPTKTVAIIGDLVADQFLSGTISRVSREAPVFIMRHEETTTLPGGGANAAANVAALGAHAILVGAAGLDDSGQKLLTALQDARVDTSAVVVDESVTTTTKVRVLTGQQFAAKNQVIRIDYEGGRLSPEVDARLRENLLSAASDADVIIVSDYNYGVVSEQAFAEAAGIARRRGIPIIVDSRFQLESFRGASSATPNQEEVEKILGPDITDADCEALRARLELDSLLVTNGNKGMTVFATGEGATNIPAVGSLTAVDVTGAGDTVIAVYALGLAAGFSFVEAAQIANHAGGIVVMKKRTATLTPQELMNSVGSNSGAN